MQTQSLGPFAGINNRLPDFSLGATKERPAFVRDAVNVDVLNSGSFALRTGQTLIQTMVGAHSFFTDATTALLVRDSILYSITRSPYTETLVKVLASNAAMSYAEFNGDIYFSNGTDSGRLSEGVAYPWAMPSVDEPTLAATAGTLDPGSYQVGITYFNNTTGEESGHRGQSVITLSAIGGISVTLPTGAVSGATHINVYVSQVNGSLSYLHSSHSVGTASVTISSNLDVTRPLEQAYIEPLPAGTSLFIHMGRLCSVVGDKLYYSEAYRFGYASAMNYIQFESDITVAQPNQFGVYVAADKTRWFAGDLTKPDQIIDVLPYGAVPGTAFTLPQNSMVGWFGAKGIVLADPQGQAEAVMTEHVDLTPPVTGCSVVLESSGFRRVVSCGWCLNVENKAVTRYTGFDYTSLSRRFGTKVDGLYELTGDTDNGAEITWEIALGKQNFGAENLKHMPAAYVGAASANAVNLRVTRPNGDEYDYAARSYSDNVEMHRIDPGKGLRDNWYDLTLFGSAAVQLASISFAPVASGRRI